MIGYASNTGTKRNLAALRDAGWRIMLTPDNPTPREGLRHSLDNGAWGCHQKAIPFQPQRFEKLVDTAGQKADFIVLPDIVGGGGNSLALSVSWLPRLNGYRSLLLPVQDDMDPKAVLAILRAWPKLGIFLGGTTGYKLATMHDWGVAAASLNRWYHVARVNTRRRIRMACACGATSFDGTSATKFSCTLPLLDAARRQPNLFAPIRTI
jgi:hypothetical protein